MILKLKSLLLLSFHDKEIAPRSSTRVANGISLHFRQLNFTSTILYSEVDKFILQVNDSVNISEAVVSFFVFRKDPLELTLL